MIGDDDRDGEFAFFVIPGTRSHKLQNGGVWWLHRGEGDGYHGWANSTIGAGVNDRYRPVGR